MKVSFCDLCGCPIHQERYLMMVVRDINADSSYQNQGSMYGMQTQNYVEKKEICRECKLIWDALFAEKAEALKRINAKIKHMMELTDG